MKNEYIIGIDLGKEGAIVVLKNGKPFFCERMPKIGKEIDWDRVIAIMFKFRKIGCHVVFEKFSGFFGYAKSAAVSLARQSGSVTAICKVLKLPYTEVLPTGWQKVMFQDARIQKKSKKMEDGKTKQVNDTKKTALLIAKRLFPHETFLATARSKKPHDGIVDAYLLAEYGRRKNL